MGFPDRQGPFSRNPHTHGDGNAISAAVSTEKKDQEAMSPHQGARPMDVVTGKDGCLWLCDKGAPLPSILPVACERTTVRLEQGRLDQGRLAVRVCARGLSPTLVASRAPHRSRTLGQRPDAAVARVRIRRCHRRYHAGAGSGWEAAASRRRQGAAPKSEATGATPRAFASTS